METVKIKGVEQSYRFGLGAQMIFEHLTGKAWDGSTNLTDLARLHYACLLNGNYDLELTFSELVDACDEDPRLFTEMDRALQNELDRFNERNLTVRPEDQTADETKKNSPQ
jgi:hypothetical protein